MKTLYTLISVASIATAFAGAPRTGGAQMPGMPGMKDMTASPFGIPMDRMGSGTTWIPDAVPIPSRAFMLGNWDMMLHGWVFAQYDKQHGPRGSSQFGSLNWGMLMASRGFLGGRFQARTMLSLDPATVSNNGYPLLLQSGETYRGASIVDRQHPHDFIMELGVLYERKLVGPVGISLYAAPSGEPALGPVAFMHRPSATELLTAPLGHHWQDATHIAFGVLSAGLFGRHWKLEGSVFNGREPDEKRWGLDRMTLDSYSGRITVNPNEQWSLTSGFGYLKSPEVLHPDESMHRVTASALYSTKFGTGRELATSFVWGANKHAGASALSPSLLFEARMTLNERHTFLMRSEYLRKSATDLLLDRPVTGFAPDQKFGIASLSLGYVRDLRQARGISIGVGGLASVNLIPGSLRAAYGSRTPAGTILFLRLRPTGGGGHSMKGMEDMHEAHR